MTRRTILEAGATALPLLLSGSLAWAQGSVQIGINWANFADDRPIRLNEPPNRGCG